MIKPVLYSIQVSGCIWPNINSRAFSLGADYNSRVIVWMDKKFLKESQVLIRGKFPNLKEQLYDQSISSISHTQSCIYFYSDTRNNCL